MATSDTPSTVQRAPDEDPWVVESLVHGDKKCDCPPERPYVPPRQPITRIKPKSKDCCQQILEAIRCIPGMDERCLNLHKPKVSPKIKIANLCGAFPVKESFAPIILLMLRRYLDGVPAGNDFESNMHGFFQSLDADNLEAMKAVLEVYQKIPATRRDCVFETRFDAWPNNKPIDPDFVAKNILGQILALGRTGRFGLEPQPQVIEGVPRPWGRAFSAPGEPGKFVTRMAPWPWICAVSPVTGTATDDVKGWYRNESACVPGNIPRGTVNYERHEFAWACTPGNTGAPWNCGNVEPFAPPATPGQFGSFAECDGGIDYQRYDKASGKNVCLTIPKVDPGAEIGLRGINFLSSNSKVHVRKIDGSFRDIDPIDITDWQPDMESDATATCAVRDFVYFRMPISVRDGLNDLQLPPGRYGIRLEVPNTLIVAQLTGSATKSYWSNEILLDLQPDPNQRYQIKVDYATCDEETDGLGADEPWFRALAVTAEVPLANTTLTFPFQNRVEIMSAEGVDTGEAISFAPATLFEGVVGKKVVAIAVFGFEVDNESVARQQIDRVYDSFGQAVEILLASTAAGASAAGLTSAIEASATAGALSPWVWVYGAALAVVVATVAIYAAWAPADPIAFDVLAYTNRQLFDLTNADLNLVPPYSWYRMNEMRMYSESLGKVADTGGGSSTFSEMRHYISTDEDSRYTLFYRFLRTSA